MKLALERYRQRRWIDSDGFRPVSNAGHGGQINPWFAIAVGALTLVYLWTKYLKGQLKEGVHFGILLGITLICILFVGTGVWELLR